jgi:hypothetical protein
MGEVGIERAVRALLRRRLGPRRGVQIQLARLRGGLESDCVVRVRVCLRGPAGGREEWAFVAKQLSDWRTREAMVYRELARSGLRLAPRCWGSEPWNGRGQGRLLLLEPARKSGPWPWRELGRAVLVLQQLACLHKSADLARSFASDGWNYEQELTDAANRTVAVLDELRRILPASARRMLPTLRRLVARLDRFRRELHASRRFGRVALHGDVHTGNAILADSAAGPELLLIDWCRARRGSPLEDVSSWTESLGLWEPEARRRHDTLIRGYLAAHGRMGDLDDELRAHYWIAAASNVLAGALEYHVRRMSETTQTSRAFACAESAVLASARVVRCAAAHWC